MLQQFLVMMVGPPLLFVGVLVGGPVFATSFGRLVEIVRRLAEGNEKALKRLLKATQGGGVLNTAYIERLNGTFRQRLAVLARRTRGLARRSEWRGEGCAGHGPGV